MLAQFPAHLGYARCTYRWGAGELRDQPPTARSRPQTEPLRRDHRDADALVLRAFVQSARAPAEGHSAVRRAEQTCLRAAASCSPWHRAAYHLMLPYLSPRGHGAVPDMMDFAWQAACQTPHGSPIALRKSGGGSP
ncbi:hypothetical protein ACQEV2_09155 [Streptomyces sp. CA-251387]|uniref:hypothetical protein n=1 Tax=Streptomyces sp. CA-251387 TaxID=3240064 RepID=UPI003D8E7831